MVRLYLLRHGEAEQGGSDSARRLSESGAVSIRKLAKFLRDMNITDVPVILHSKKLRSRETAEIVTKEAFPSARLTETVFLGPDDEPWEAARYVERAKGSLMLVGHLPHIGLLTSILTSGRTETEGFRFVPGALLCLERTAERFEGADAMNRWVALWMMSPELLS